LATDAAAGRFDICADDWTYPPTIVHTWLGDSLTGARVDALLALSAALKQAFPRWRAGCPSKSTSAITEIPRA
jgi:hypothetical protein